MFGCAVFARSQTAVQRDLADFTRLVKVLAQRGDNLQRFRVVMSERSKGTHLEMWELPANWTTAMLPKAKLLGKASVSNGAVHIDVDRFPHLERDISLNRALLAILPKLAEVWPRTGAWAHNATFEVNRNVTDEGYHVLVWYLPASPDIDTIFSVDNDFKTVEIGN